MKMEQEQLFAYCFQKKYNTRTERHVRLWNSILGQIGHTACMLPFPKQKIMILQMSLTAKKEPAQQNVKQLCGFFY